MIHLQTQKILQKEMDRKAFLKNTGIAFAGLVGVTALIKSLNVLGGESPLKQSLGPVNSYGALTYGGLAAKK